MLNDIEILDLSRKVCIPLPEIYTQGSIPVSQNDIPKQEDIREWAYLDEIVLPEVDAGVGLLIGNNVPKALEPLEVINSHGNGPFSCRTALGWMVFGVSKLRLGGSRVSSHRVLVKADLQQQFTDLYNQDFTERVVEDKPERSQDEKFLRKVEESIKLVDGHYQLALPFKTDDVKLPNNRPVAEQRLAHLQRKFKRKPEFHERYKEFMDSVFEKDYAEEVPEKDLKRSDGKVWYLPHHGVVHPQKGKLRVVYDCSASFKEHSLNKELLQGPDITNSLLGVLQRFRQDRVALIADIEGMFSQVLVPEQDRDFLRLLWWEDGRTDGNIKEYRMKVHVFGAVSSPSTANFALKKTASDQAEKYNDEVVHTIQHNFYVDDCLCSTSKVRRQFN